MATSGSLLELLGACSFKGGEVYKHSRLALAATSKTCRGERHIPVGNCLCNDDVLSNSVNALDCQSGPQNFVWTGCSSQRNRDWRSLSVELICECPSAQHSLTTKMQPSGHHSRCNAGVSNCPVYSTPARYAHGMAWSSMEKAGMKSEVSRPPDMRHSRE